MEHWLPKGGGSSTPDGVFERFLTAAIATVITIMFSWRLLDGVGSEERKEDENEPSRHKLGHSSQSSFSSSFVSLASPFKESIGRSSSSNSRQGAEARSGQGSRPQSESNVQRELFVSNSAASGQPSGSIGYRMTNAKPFIRVPVDLPLCGDERGHIAGVHDTIESDATGARSQLNENKLTAYRLDNPSHHVTVMNSYNQERAGCEQTEDTHTRSVASTPILGDDLVDITDSSLEDVEFIGVEGNSDLFLNLSTDSGDNNTTSEDYRHIVNNENYKPFRVPDHTMGSNNSEDGGEHFLDSYTDDFENDDTQPRELSSEELIFFCSMLEPISEEDSEDLTGSNEEDASRSENGSPGTKGREVEYDLEYEEGKRGIISPGNRLAQKPIYSVKNSSSFWDNKYSGTFSTVNTPSRAATLLQKPATHLSRRLPDPDKQDPRLPFVNTRQATGPDYKPITGSEALSFTCSSDNTGDGPSVSNVLDTRVASNVFPSDHYYEYIRCHGSSVDRLSPTLLTLSRSKEDLLSDSKNKEVQITGEKLGVEGEDKISVPSDRERDHAVPHSFVQTVTPAGKGSNFESDNSIHQTSTEGDITPVIGHKLTSGLRSNPVKAKRPVSDGFVYATKRLKSEDEEEAFFRDRVVSEGGGVAFGEVRSGDDVHESVVVEDRRLGRDEGSGFRNPSESYNSQFSTGNSYTTLSESVTSLPARSVFCSGPPHDLDGETSSDVDFDQTDLTSLKQIRGSQSNRDEVDSGKQIHNSDSKNSAVKDVSGVLGRNSAASLVLKKKHTNSRFMNSQSSREDRSKLLVDKMEGREYYSSESMDRVSDRNNMSVRTEDEETEWEEEIIETFVLPESHEMTILRTLQSVKDLLDQRNAVTRSELIPRDEEDDVDEACESTCLTTMIDVEGHSELGFTGDEDVTSGYRDQYEAVARTDGDLKERLGFELNLDEFKTDEYNTESGWPIVRYIEKERFYVQDNEDDEKEEDRDGDVRDVYNNDLNDGKQEGREFEDVRDENEEENTYVREDEEVIDEDEYDDDDDEEWDVDEEEEERADEADVEEMDDNDRDADLVDGRSSRREMDVVAEEDEEQHSEDVVKEEQATEDEYDDEDDEEWDEDDEEPHGEEELKDKRITYDVAEDQYKEKIHALPNKTELVMSIDSKEINLPMPSLRPPEEDYTPVKKAQPPPYLRSPSGEQFAKLEQGNIMSPTLSIPPSPIVTQEKKTPKCVESSQSKEQGGAYTAKEQRFSTKSAKATSYTSSSRKLLDEFNASEGDVASGSDHVTVEYEDFVREMTSKESTQLALGRAENYPSLTPDRGSAILSGNLATPLNKKDVFVFPKEEPEHSMIKDKNDNVKEIESEVNGGKRSEDNEPLNEANVPVKKPRLVRTSTAQDEEELLGFKSGFRRSSSSSLFDGSTGVLNRSFDEGSSNSFALERMDSEPGVLNRNISSERLSRRGSRETILLESPSVEYRHFPESPRKFYPPQFFSEPTLDVVLESTPVVGEEQRTGSSSTDSAPTTPMASQAKGKALSPPHITPVASQAKENALISPLPVIWTRVVPGSNFIEEKRMSPTKPSPAVSVNSPDTVDGSKLTSPLTEKVNKEDFPDLDFADADDIPETGLAVSSPTKVSPAKTPERVAPTSTKIKARPLSAPPKPPLAPKPRTSLSSVTSLEAPPASAVTEKTSSVSSPHKMESTAVGTSSVISQSKLTPPHLQSTLAASVSVIQPPNIPSPKQTQPASTPVEQTSHVPSPELAPPTSTPVRQPSHLPSPLPTTVPAKKVSHVANPPHIQLISTPKQTQPVPSPQKSIGSSNIPETLSASSRVKKIPTSMTPTKPPLAPKPRKASVTSKAVEADSSLTPGRLSPTFGVDRMERKIELDSPVFQKCDLTSKVEAYDVMVVDIDSRDGKVNDVDEEEKKSEEEMQEDEEGSEEDEEEEEEEEDSEEEEEEEEEESGEEEEEEEEEEEDKETETGENALEESSVTPKQADIDIESNPFRNMGTRDDIACVTSSESHKKSQEEATSNASSLGTAWAPSQFTPGSPRKPKSMKEIKKRSKQPYKSVLTNEPTTPTSPKIAPFVLPESLLTPSRLKIIQSRNRFMSEQNWLSDPFAGEFEAHKKAMAHATTPVKDRKYAPKMTKHPSYRSQEQLDKIMYMINLKHGRSEGSLHKAHADCLHDDCILSEKGRREVIDKALSIDSLHMDLYRHLQRFDSETDTDGRHLSDAYFPETNSDLFDLTFPFQSDGGRYLERPASMSELRHASDYSTISGSGASYFDTPGSKGKGRFTQRQYKKSKSLCTLETNLDDVNFATSKTEEGLQRVPSAHELRISKSLQKLNAPNWYKQSSLSKSGSCLLKYGSSSSMTSWAFSPSLISSPCTTPSNTSNVVIRSRVQLPTSSRNLRSPRFTSKSAPSTPSFMNQSDEEKPATPTPVKLPSEKMRSKDKPKALMPIPIVPFDKIRAMFEKNKEDDKAQKSRKEDSPASQTSSAFSVTKTQAQRPTMISPPKAFAANGDETNQIDDVIPKVIVSPTDPNVKSILKRPNQEKRYSDIQESPEADDEPAIIRPVPTKPLESAPTITLSQAPTLISPPQPPKQQPTTKPPITEKSEIKQKPVPPERSKPAELKSAQNTKAEAKPSPTSKEEQATPKRQKEEDLPVPKSKGFAFFKSLRSSSSSSTEDIKEKGRKSPREKGQKPTSSQSVSADSSYDSPDAFPASPASRLSPVGTQSPPTITITPDTSRSKGPAYVNVSVGRAEESANILEPAPAVKPLAQKSFPEERITRDTQAASYSEPSKQDTRRTTRSPESVQETNLDDSFETEMMPEPRSKPEKKRSWFPKSKSSTSKSPEEPSKLTSKPKITDLQSKFEIQQLSGEPRRLRSPVESEGSRSGNSQQEHDRSKNSASLSEDSRSITRDSDLDRSRDSYSSRSGDRSRESERDYVRDSRIPERKPLVEPDRSFTRSPEPTADRPSSRDLGSVRSGRASEKNAPIDDSSRSSDSFKGGRYSSSEDDRRDGSRDSDYDRDYDRRDATDSGRKDREFDRYRDYDKRDRDNNRDRDYRRRDMDYDRGEEEHDGRGRVDTDRDRRDTAGRRDRDFSSREGSLYSRDESDTETRRGGDMDRSSLPRGSAMNYNTPRDSRIRRPSDNYEDTTTSRTSLSSGRSWQPKPRGSRGSDSSPPKRVTPAAEEQTRTSKPSWDSNGTSENSSPYRYRVAGSAFSAPRPNTAAGINTPPSSRRDSNASSKPDSVSAGPSKSLKETTV